MKIARLVTKIMTLKRIKTGKYMNCKLCKKSFYFFLSKIRVFCSKKCSQKYQVGENNPCYRGGVMDIKGYERYRVRKKELKKKGIDTSKSFKFLEWIDLKKKYNFLCPCCFKREPEIHLTVDHIKPISKGGTDELKNIQPLCHSCNSRKYNKFIKYPIPLQNS